MNELKLSIITVCYNAELTIERCIRSVISQGYNNIQYIVIDGASTDGTLSLISKYKTQIDIIVSEPDEGIYDAMNKGIAMAAGDVIGMLNADDVFANDDVLSDIAGAFASKEVDLLYGDLNYLKHNGNVFRKWVSGEYTPGLFNRGWMPPHPTFYCKRLLFAKFGNYNSEFGTAADYELMLRFIHAQQASIFYLRKVLINMYVGGVSNNSYIGRGKVLFLDFKAMYKNGVKYPPIALLLKRLTKISQFF